MSQSNMGNYTVGNVMENINFSVLVSETHQVPKINIYETFINDTGTENNETENGIYYYYFYKTEQLTFLWVIFILIVVTNSAVIGGLVMSKNRKSRMNFFITHLAIADLTVGLINVLTDIIWRTTVDFHGGNVVCKLVKYLQVLVTYSSTYVLVVLSIDRYDAITHPMKFSGSWRRSRILVASAWGLSAAFSIPAIFLNEEEVIRGHTQCWIDLQPWQWQIYISLVAMSLFFIPALIISLCYSVIVYTIWTKSKIMGYPKMVKSSTTIIKGNSLKRKYSLQDNDRKRASSRGIIPRAKIKTVKMTFVIVFVFILCWSPYFMYDLLQVYGYIPENQTSIAVSTFIQSLAPLNSAANPIIYCLFSAAFWKNPRKYPLCSFLARKLPQMCPSRRNSTRTSASGSRGSKFHTNTTKSTGINSSRTSTLQKDSTKSKLSVTLLKKRSVDNGIVCEIPCASRNHGNTHL